MSQQLQTYASDKQRVKDLLSKCGLNQYYERFEEEGFDQLISVRITRDVAVIKKKFNMLKFLPIYFFSYMTLPKLT